MRRAGAGAGSGSPQQSSGRTPIGVTTVVGGFADPNTVPVLVVAFVLDLLSLSGFAPFAGLPAPPSSAGWPSASSASPSTRPRRPASSAPSTPAPGEHRPLLVQHPRRHLRAPGSALSGSTLGPVRSAAARHRHDPEGPGDRAARPRPPLRGHGDCQVARHSTGRQRVRPTDPADLSRHSEAATGWAVTGQAAGIRRSSARRRHAAGPASRPPWRSKTACRRRRENGSRRSTSEPPPHTPTPLPPPLTPPSLSLCR